MTVKHTFQFTINNKVIVSEYQYYKFERLDGYLDAEARQALRSISSRA